MEGTFAILLLTLCALVLTKILATVYHQYTYWQKLGVPVESNFPLIGSAWRFLVRRVTPVEHVNYFYRFHPERRCVGGMDFATPILVVRDPELIKDIAVKNFDHCPNHKTFIDEEMDPIFGRNVFSLRDERWKEMRNTLTPSFTASKMRIMFELVSKCAKEFVDYLEDNPKLTESLDLKDAFTRYTNDVIATVAFGISVNSMKNRDNEFYLKGKDVSSFSGFAKTIKFIMLRSSPRLSRLLGLSFLSADATRFLKQILSDTVKTRDEQGIVRPDMIQLLMQAREKNSSFNMTMEDIIAQGFIFFLAGFDTSSSLMCFMAYELAFHQDIQDKLREEVDEFMEKTDGNLGYEEISKMTYLEMVVAESLRKYPPLVFLDRQCSKPFEIPKSDNEEAILVEKDTVCLFPIYSLQNDPKYFPDPEKFDPERFNESNKEKVNPYVYMPFGIGPRKCIGNRFALMEIKVIMAFLLHRFIFKTNEKTGTMPVTFSKKQFNLIPVNGFWLTLERRK